MNGNTGAFVRTAITVIVGVISSFVLYFMQVARSDLNDLRHEVTVARQESRLENINTRSELMQRMNEDRKEFYERIALMERRLR